MHNWFSIVELVKQGKTVQLCFKKPTHYIAVIAYDEDTDEMIYNDLWARHRKTNMAEKRIWMLLRFCDGLNRRSTGIIPTSRLLQRNPLPGRWFPDRFMWEGWASA